MDVVSVLVPASFVEDGEALPRVGDDVVYRLSFFEVLELDDPDPVLHRVWNVLAAPCDGGQARRNQPLGGPPSGPPRWSTLLHGPGWTASFRAPRPLSGPVVLRGLLVADHDVVTGDGAAVAGRGTRVRIVTQAERSGPVHRGLVAGSRAVHDVDTSPAVFDRGDGGPPPSAPHQPVPTTPARGADLPPDVVVRQLGVLTDITVS